MSNQVIKASPSVKTAIFSWLTKMLFQWVVLCIPMLVIFHYICPEIVGLLALKLLLNSTLVAFAVTGLMMFGRITLNNEGLSYENKLLLQKAFIPWKEMIFGKPFPITLEKHYAISRRGGGATIKIWPSLNNYSAIKKCFEDHQIFLETGQIATPKNQFRPLDEVISEALK
ncbi:MAG: hypothetical protein IPK14_06630 [Blastocatellia bacterium]|nr:hypothetical protein [Blastocatellia bacterium]